MSGFTRDSKHYGDRLVYEALGSKWDRYHSHCGCGQDWLSAHAEPAGFTVVRKGSGFVALVGPGLTEGVDEDRLTTNALWEAVTGRPGVQNWFEPVRTFDRSPESETGTKSIRTEKERAVRRAQDAAQRRAPITPAQLGYLQKLVTSVSRQQFDEALTSAVKGSPVEARRPDEKTAQVIERMTKLTARKLIAALVGEK